MIDVFWHDAVLDHDTGEGHFELPASPLLAVQERHPESAPRIANMKSMLERGPLADRVRWRDGRLAEVAELQTVHDPAYVAWVQEAIAGGGTRLYGHTVLTPRSWEPLRAAAGTALAATDAVLAAGGGDEAARVALALVRPPGHHAQPARADGYCFFNHVALAAERARRAGVERVAIVDWDVHHGNGTQACFYERADVLTISLHMRTGLWGPSHPQTGGPSETGLGPGAGHNVNVELPLGSGDLAYAMAFDRIVAPILREYDPQLIVGACGQDASAFDPNGRMNVTMDGFRALGRSMGTLADELTDGRLLLVQEGGYAPTYAAFCLHATLEGVLGEPEPLLQETLAFFGDDLGTARAAIDGVHSALARHWALRAR
ncbi:MAG TPA: histone deacetylase [Baekduia sp.]|uniref:histone deacetylase n=1 Tax=Baekduia sp. TaxID=2600305 RepID=UPI002D77A520|nr:histone deacetylase [Baekduia sp.]HET6505879.1 histone deacetylase [Baekduia sp.]